MQKFTVILRKNLTLRYKIFNIIAEVSVNLNAQCELAHRQSETNLGYLRPSRWQASEKLETNLG